MLIESQNEGEKLKTSQEKEPTPLKSNEVKTAIDSEVSLLIEEEKGLSAVLKEPTEDVQGSMKENELLQSVDEKTSTKEDTNKTTAQGKTYQEQIIKKDESNQESVYESVDDQTKKVDQLKIADPKKEDDVGRPEFETAPNVSLDESQEDHTQVN